MCIWKSTFVKKSSRFSDDIAKYDKKYWHINKTCHCVVIYWQAWIYYEQSVGNNIFVILCNKIAVTTIILHCKADIQ